MLLTFLYRLACTRIAWLLLIGLFWSLPSAASSLHLVGWEYRWGDSPFNEQGPEWTQADEPEAWHSLAFPSNPPNRSGQEQVWYRTQLPENHWQDPVIYIYSIDLLAEVYLGEQKIYHFGKLDEEGKGRFAGWPWHLIELPEDFAGQTLYFRVYSDYTDIGLWGEVKLIERADLLLRIIDTSWFDLLVILFCVLVALLALVFAAMQATTRKSFLYLSLLLLAAAGKLLGENQAVQLILDAPLFRTYLAAASYFSLPLFIYLLLKEWVGSLDRQLATYMVFVHLGYLALATLASVLGWVQLSITYPVFDLLFTLSLALLLYLTARHFKQLQQDEMLVILAFWVLSVFLLVDMAVAHGFLPWGRFPLSLGVLIFGLTLLVLALTDYKRTQKQIQELNTTLEERISQRTASLQAYAQLERQRSHQLHLLNRYNQELEETVTQLETCNHLEEACKFLEQRFSELFRPYQVIFKPFDVHSQVANDHMKWMLMIEDMQLGRQPLAWLQLQPDTSLDDQQQLEQLTQFIGRAADRLSMTLTGIKLRQDLQRLSYEDALTGLKNRRYLDESLEREVSLAKRNKSTLAVLMCDLDHFKSFNDAYGHDAGDQALRNLASLLQEHFRETDLPCRFGGEEFVIIMPGASEAIALKRAQELLSQLAARNLYYQGKNLGQMTLSAGIAIWPCKALTAQELLKAADRALYLAKQKGRNRVEMANNKDA
ncbi:diguanylate cyclase (GGDEF) domain-containing protein [Marinospirillum celere]|uniref:diguanylate cyclase n=1 Tax=Marinospirillum celere TaxID=1122252 RepID=A0A1I1DX05_9GAMM|nr:GGDEF domain-containing protein [Marinospirillum celere]SFB78946.1 diguanylate cyclase (GGDEF) domain-containing protein [Marinospirillum celere]